MLDRIVIRGAREHNLKDVNVDIPHGRLSVISGVSGSGKSSLAFDTLYAEGQRRYIESLTTYAKQFLERIARPDVDEVSGISPSIAIQQVNTTRSSRSTVGTTTEIYDYLRLLFARVGRTYCPDCGTEVVQFEPDEVVDELIGGCSDTTLLFIARMSAENGVTNLVDRLLKSGYRRILLRGKVEKLDEVPKSRYSRLAQLDVVLDRVAATVPNRTRMFEAVESAYRMADGFVWVVDEEGKGERKYTKNRMCASCQRTFEEPRPILFSFNTPYGACPHCRGFGNRMEFDERLIVPDPTLSIREHAIEPWASAKFEYFYDLLVRYCKRKRISLVKPFKELSERARTAILEGDGDFEGVIPFLDELREKSYKKYARFYTRRYLTFTECRRCRGGLLREEAYYVRLGDKTIREVSAMVPADALEFVDSLRLTSREEEIAKDILLELRSRLKFMLDVGLYYLTLDRLTRTLSGGEAQRINLANSLGANLIGVLYVLDEPSVGLHPRDTQRLVDVLKELRDRGNTVVIVEHDLDIIRHADYLIDLGPGAGRYGGELLYAGELASASHPQSKTIKYLNSGLPLRNSRTKTPKANNTVSLEGVSQHNLKKIDVSFPLEAFTVVTGVSGSGKSTLVCDVLYNALRVPDANRTYAYQDVSGREHITKVMLVDQSPIGKTPRSNPITYIKAFSYIRDVLAAQNLSKKRGYTSGRFSFNVPGGRCSKCDGVGYERIEMHFMADLFVRCSECDGKRFNEETLEVAVCGKNVAEILDMTVEEALTFFKDHKSLVDRLMVLKKVGLGYLQLGQPSTTLSGGESQRIKIARELTENMEGDAVYILDEPTTGLHIDDVDVLISVLRELVENGNTVVVVEHNPQVILQADHIIDLGPGGGEDGGCVVGSGKPSELMRVRESHTAAYLRKLVRKGRKGTV
ncbi:MAG: excinuclease ABC subunit UvrA [Candidatus Latescibacterota bacterium]|nr:MAG: excinuclease ABC subunit UvrA [Candidatus Latescibacterota bacterium]